VICKLLFKNLVKILKKNINSINKELKCKNLKFNKENYLINLI